MSVEPKIEDLGGMWRRSLIAWPDGTRDTTTWVGWLQGRRLYIDLRQPIGRPDFRAATCLDQLTRQHVDWLVRQEGFAGELRYRDGYFEWHREIDFQITARHPDQGRLRGENGMLVEHGKDDRYVEHWHRDGVSLAPMCAVRFEDRPNTCQGYIVRVGHLFMYARGRRALVGANLRLAEHVASGPTLAAARDLLDCEISQGVVTTDAWIIRRSTLPFKEGLRLDPRLVPGRTATLSVADLSRDGRRVERRVEITDIEGELRDLCSAGAPGDAVVTGERL